MQTFYDVIVCGAGPSGFGAAWGAAKAGKKVLLIDKNSGPGGVACFCCCPVFQGINSHEETTLGGVVRQFAFEMRDCSFIVRNTTLNSSEFEVGLIMNRMINSLAIDRLYYTTLIEAELSGNHIDNVTLFSCGKKIKVSANAFVDCTGDAILSDLCHVEFLEASNDDTMTKTVTFRVSGVEKFDKVALLEQFPNLGFPFSHQDRFMGTPVCGNQEILLNLTAVAGDALDPVDLTRMDMELREQIPVVLEWAKRKLPGFAHCRLSAVAPVIGVRGSRNIAAQEVITLEDLCENRSVAEPVALGRRSFGGHYIHSFSSPWGRDLCGFRGVPYGALLTKTVDNLFVGGRCIGCEPKVTTAIRLMPTCMLTGQAAGIAAAFAATMGEIVPYAKIKPELIKQNISLTWEGK